MVSAHGTEDRMFVAAGGRAAISASQGYGAALNRVLAGGIVFRNDERLTTWLAGSGGPILRLLQRKPDHKLPANLGRISRFVPCARTIYPCR